MSFYAEKQRAIRQADHIINEILYIQKKGINILELEINETVKFQCNFMKIFYERLSLFMSKDKNIVHDVKKKEIFYKKKYKGDV